VLSGAMFPFSRLNTAVGGGHHVPVLAHFMPAKWAYEGAMVDQFENNKYNALFFELDKEISFYDFRVAHVFPQLKKTLQQLSFAVQNGQSGTNESAESPSEMVDFVVRQLQTEAAIQPELFVELLGEDFDQLAQRANADAANVELLAEIVTSLYSEYESRFNEAFNKKEKVLEVLSADSAKAEMLKTYKLLYTNDAVAEQVKNQASLLDAYAMENGVMIQLSDPIFQKGAFEYNNGLSAPFFASSKGFFGWKLSAYWFNILVLWCMVIILFISLEFNLFKNLINLPSLIKFNQSK